MFKAKNNNNSHINKNSEGASNKTSKLAANNNNANVQQPRF
jgi:hypothetical protein